MLTKLIYLTLALLPLLANGHPVLSKRALSETETSVLQLALYLERLEFTLYTQGFNNYTEEQYRAAGFEPEFRANVGKIAENEAVHIETISTVLTSNGVTPVPPCTYRFPATDPRTFVSVANMITTVGIGAYIGGAAPLSTNDQLLTAASAILSVEARHDSYLRAGLGASPFPTPFDTALTGVYAYNLAQMFVVSCPVDLPIIKLPKLVLAAPQPDIDLQPPVPAGTVLTFTFDPSTFFVPVDPNATLYVAFINQITNTYFAPLTKTSPSSGTVVLPEGLGNIAFAVLTTFSGPLTLQQLTTFGTLAGPVEVPLS